MRARLIGHDVRRHAEPYELRKHLGGVSDESDRERPLRPYCLTNPREGLLQSIRLAVAIARCEALVDSGLVDLHTEQGGAVHRGGERLRSAHAAEARREHEAAG